MGSLFSMLSSYDKIVVSLIIIAITFVISLLSAFLVSFKLRGSKGFFITSAIMPIIVAAVISMVSIFLDDATSGAVRIATIAVALGLIRFRSMNAKAEELLILFSGVATGLIAGLGYVVFALLFSLIVSALYILLSSLVNLFLFHIYLVLFLFLHNLLLLVFLVLLMVWLNLDFDILFVRNHNNFFGRFHP